MVVVVAWQLVGVGPSSAWTYYPVEVEPFYLINQQGAGYPIPVAARRDVIEDHMLKYGAFDKPVLQLLLDVAERLPANPRVVQAGANIGHYALASAAEGARVIAFEPYMPVFDKLNKARRFNGMETIAALPYGLGAVSEMAPFSEPSLDNMGMGSFVVGFNAPDGPSTVLQVEQGDRVLADIGVSQLDLLFGDTEGGEGAVLRGFRESLRRQLPVIVMELTRRPWTLRHFFEPGQCPGYEELADIAVDPKKMWMLLRDVLPRSYTKLLALRPHADGRHTGAYSLGDLPRLRPDQIGNPYYDQVNVVLFPQPRVHLFQDLLEQGGRSDPAPPPMLVTHEWRPLVPPRRRDHSIRHLLPDSMFAVMGTNDEGPYLQYRRIAVSLRNDPRALVVPRWLGHPPDHLWFGRQLATQASRP